MNGFISKEGFLITTDEPEVWLKESIELAKKGYLQKGKELALKALSWYQISAAKAFNEDGDITCSIGEGNCLWQLGIMHTQNNEWQDAEKIFKHAAEVFRRVYYLQENSDNITNNYDAAEVECDVLYNLTIVYGHLGKYKESLSICRNLIQYYKKSGNKKKEVMTLQCAGIALLSLDRDNEALDILEQALKIACQTGDKKLENSIRKTIDTCSE